MWCPPHVDYGSSTIRHTVWIMQRTPHCRWQDSFSSRGAEELYTQPLHNTAHQKQPERPRIVLIMGT
jgi:hypothetical protein